jgi:hypothetical protein
MERVRAVQLAGMNQADEKTAHLRSVQGFVETLHHRPFQAISSTYPTPAENLPDIYELAQHQLDHSRCFLLLLFWTT